MKTKMKWFKTNLKAIQNLFFILVSSTTFATEFNENWIERKKMFNYSYDLKASDKISINNQFGDVKMQLWNKETIRVIITVTANAPTEAKAEDFLKIVSVETTKETGQISFKTLLDYHSSSSANNLNWSKKIDDKNQLRVDYLIYLPNNHQLTIDNSFGDIYLPEFTSEVHLKQNYGTLFAENISNIGSNIEVNFGKAFIKSMNGGDLKAQYSDLVLDEANKTRLENNFGKLRIKRLIDVDGIISYSSGFLETIKEAANFKIDFSNGIKVGNVSEEVKHLEFECNYSTVELPFNNIEDCNFEVETTNGKVKFPENREIRFSRNSDTEKKTTGYTPNRFYFGTMGDGKTTPMKVIIKSNYGNVKIK